MENTALQELKKLITDARDEAKEDRKKVYHEDREEKMQLTGQIEGYNFCLDMIRFVNENYPIIP